MVIYQQSVIIQGCQAVSPVQKLCLLKLVRAECLVAAIQQYVVTSLGPNFAEPGPVSLKSVKKDSNNNTPIIFILSPGGPKALSPLLIQRSSAAWVGVVVASVLLAVVGVAVVVASMLATMWRVVVVMAKVAVMLVVYHT